MKQRLISAFIGLLILAVVFVFLDTLLFNIIMGVVSIIAVLELLSATGCLRFRGLSVLAVLITFVIPFAQESAVRALLPQIMFALVLVFFLILLKYHTTLRVEQFAMAFLFSVFVPVFFSCAVYLRNDFGPDIGGFYLLWALGSAWLCDSGAYFVGRAFGRHKLAPQVSPKKTVEGAVGGVITAALLMLLIGWLYQLSMAYLGRPIIIHYLPLALLTPLFALIGMLGDLSASVIKRQFGVKDYGNIMPGHGGVLDRFDSALFTLPSVYIVVQHIGVAVSALS